MDEYTPYCALCGGPIQNPDVQAARVEMGVRISSTWLSEAVLLHAEAADFPNIAIHELAAKNQGGPIFELLDSREQVTACDVSTSIVPSPRPLYLPCHTACMTIAEKVIISIADQSLHLRESILPHRSITGSKQHIWRVLKARFEEASEGKFQPVTNIGLIHDYDGIRRFQGLAWEPGSDGVLEEESQLFEADPLHIPNLTSSILSHLKPSLEQYQTPPDWKRLFWLWDIDNSIVACKAKESTELNQGDRGWDWEILYSQLGSRELYKPGAILQELPIGLRNRCRIWRLVEDLLNEEVKVSNEATDGED